MSSMVGWNDFFCLFLFYFYRILNENYPIPSHRISSRNRVDIVAKAYAQIFCALCFCTPNPCHCIGCVTARQKRRMHGTISVCAGFLYRVLDAQLINQCNVNLTILSLMGYHMILTCLRRNCPMLNAVNLENS